MSAEAKRIEALVTKLRLPSKPKEKWLSPSFACEEASGGPAMFTSLPTPLMAQSF
jgi:hypothetical protein